jgi:hypothetical protein
MGYAKVLKEKKYGHMKVQGVEKKRKKCEHMKVHKKMKIAMSQSNKIERDHIK